MICLCLGFYLIVLLLVVVGGCLIVCDVAASWFAFNAYRFVLY